MPQRVFDTLKSRFGQVSEFQKTQADFHRPVDLGHRCWPNGAETLRESPPINRADLIEEDDRIDAETSLGLRDEHFRRVELVTEL